MEEIYVKRDSSLLISNKFVYEVTVSCHYENYFCIVNTTMFESETIIEKIVESYFISKHIQVSCELFSAPIEYIKDEGYKLWVKPPKKPHKPRKKK